MGLDRVLAALVAARADSHANLDLIFGAHRRVLGRLVEFKHQYVVRPARLPETERNSS